MVTNVAGPSRDEKIVRDYCGRVAVFDFYDAPRATKSESTIMYAKIALI